MPIYEYQCTSCKARSEVIQSISDAPLTQCSDCGGEMKKLISSPAIQFKGSGFYKTDYPSATSKGGGSSSKSSDSSKSESAATETKSETKSESTKSESKSDSPS